jgi:putative ABC transport system ATP-binding protein
MLASCSTNRHAERGGFELELTDIGRRHPRADQWLLRGISCDLGPGDRLAVVGPSGSGKSLLLRVMALLDPVDAGAVLWQGEPVRGLAVPDFRCQVMYVHQQPALVEGTVEHNLRQPYLLERHRRRRGGFDKRRVADLLEQLGRDASLLDKPQNVLSGGEAQLVCLVRAMQLDPSVLLLDEPPASLDSPTARSVERAVQRWLDERPEARAIVWVSHDTQQATRVSNRHLRIEQGRMQGEP